MPPTCRPHLRRATTSVLVAVALVSGAILLLGDRFDVAPSYAMTQPVRFSARIAACVAEENMRLINPDQEQCRPEEIELASGRSGLQPATGLPVASGPPGPPGPPGPAGPAGPPGPEASSPAVKTQGGSGGPGAPGRTSAAAGIGPAGAPGPTGPPGPGGPTGRAGADGVSGFEIVTAKVAVPSRQAASGEARCPAGKVALGGGVLPDPEGSRKAEEHMNVVVSAPLLPGGDGGHGWAVTVRNTSAAALSVVVAVVCVALR